MMVIRNRKLALRTACAGGALALLLGACGEPTPDAGDPAVAPPPEEQGQVIEPAPDQQSMATGDQLDATEDPTTQQ